MSTYTGTFYERIPGQDPMIFALHYSGSPADLIEEHSYSDDGLDLYDGPGSDDEFILYVHDRFFLVLTEYEGDMDFETSYYQRSFKGLIVNYMMNDTAMASVFTLLDGGKKLADVEYEETIYSVKINGVDFAGLRDQYDPKSDIMTTMGKLIPKLLNPPVVGKIEMKRLHMVRHPNWQPSMPIDETQIRLEHVRQFLNNNTNDNVKNKDTIYADDENIEPEKLAEEIRNAGLVMPDYDGLLQRLEGKSLLELNELCTSIGPMNKAKADDLAILLLAYSKIEKHPLPFPESKRTWNLPERNYEEYIFDQELYDKIFEKEKQERKKRTEKRDEKKQKQTEKEKELLGIRIEQKKKADEFIKADKTFAARMADPEYDINVHYFNEIVKEVRPDIRQPYNYPQLEKSITKIKNLGQEIAPLPGDYLVIYRWSDELLIKEYKTQFDISKRYNPQGNPLVPVPIDIYIRCAILHAETIRRKTDRTMVTGNMMKKPSFGSIAWDVIKVIFYVIAFMLAIARLASSCS